MPKTAKILIIVIVLAGLTVAGIKVKDYFEKQAFLKNLKGEIVYANNGDIYKFSPQKNQTELLYSVSGEYRLGEMRTSDSGAKLFLERWKWKNKDTLKTHSEIFVMNPNTKEDRKISSQIKKIFFKRKESLLQSERNSTFPIIKECGRELSWKDQQKRIHTIYKAKAKPSLKKRAKVKKCRWSPNKKNIIFVEKGNEKIKVIDRPGKNVMTIGRGRTPDWVY